MKRQTQLFGIPEKKFKKGNKQINNNKNQQHPPRLTDYMSPPHLCGALTAIPTELLAFKSSGLKASINLIYFKSRQENANKHYYLFDSMSQILRFIIPPNLCN